MRDHGRSTPSTVDTSCGREIIDGRSVVVRAKTASW
jgi:hypothetical protein